MIKFLFGLLVGAALVTFLETMNMWHTYYDAAPCCTYTPAPLADVPSVAMPTRP